MKLKLKLPSFGPAKPALPGSAEAEAYEATAEARAQAAPFASSGILKRRPEDEADDGPALKRLNSGVQAVTDAGMPPPLARPASFKFTMETTLRNSGTKLSLESLRLASMGFLFCNF